MMIWYPNHETFYSTVCIFNKGMYYIFKRHRNKSTKYMWMKINDCMAMMTLDHCLYMYMA